MAVLALLLVAGAVYAAWAMRAVEIRGRVALRAWDGAVAVPESAQALVFARSAARTMLQQQFEAWPESRAVAEERQEAARRAWRERVAAREEALKILRVAEQANAADLAACRARYNEAESAARSAYATLEERTAAFEESSDPAALVADWRGSLDGGEVGGDGRLVLRARVGQRPVVVVLSGAGETGPGQAWLAALPAAGGVVEVEFSNTNVLTWEGLREFAGLEKEAVGGKR